MDVTPELQENSEEIQLICKQISIFLGTLSEMHGKMELADVTLTCGQRVFKAHKVILCANSPYFRTMFSNELTEAKSGDVNLQGIDPESLEVILSVIYFRPFPKMCETKRLKSLLAASHKLQFANLFEYCCDEYMKKFDHNNFLDIWNTAELYDAERMLKVIPVELAKQFDVVITSNDFLSLSLTQLRSIVQQMKKDEKQPSDIVLKSILDWIKQDQTTRTQHLPQLLLMVDLNYVSPDYLSTLLKSENVLKNCVDVREQIIAAAATRLSGLNLRQEEKHGKLAVLGICNYVYRNPGTNIADMSRYQLQYYDKQTDKWSIAVKLPCEYAFGNYTPVIVKDVLYCITTIDPIANGDGNHTYGYFPRGNAFGYGRKNAVGSGNVTTHNYTTRVIKYCLRSDLPPLECCTLAEYRTTPGAAALNDDIYIVGGTDHNRRILHSVERYSVTQNKRVTVQSTINPHCTQAVASSSNYLFVANEDRRQIVIEQYDPKVDQWQMLEFPVLPSRAFDNFRPACNMATCAGRIFVIHQGDLFEYCPEKNSFRNIIISGLSIVAVGGMSNPKTECPYVLVLASDHQVYQFQPDNQSFTKIATDPAILTAGLRYFALTDV